MSRFFFMLCALLVLVGVAFMALNSLNLLPPSVSTFIDSYFGGLSQSTYPYLQKYEGSWQIALTPQSATSDIATCLDNTGPLLVHNGILSGSLSNGDGSESITATIDENGMLSGTLSRAQEVGAPFTGQIVGTQGSGTWKDTLDCQGTFTLTKTDPVNDPVVATLVSYSGDVELIRSGRQELPSPGMRLYQGDMIQVSASAEALLSVGLAGTPLDIPSGTTYTVPAPDTQ